MMQSQFAAMPSSLNGGNNGSTYANIHAHPYHDDDNKGSSHGNSDDWTTMNRSHSNPGSGAAGGSSDGVVRTMSGHINHQMMRLPSSPTTKVMDDSHHQYSGPEPTGYFTRQRLRLHRCLDDGAVAMSI